MGSTITVRPRFSWNPQDFKVAGWEDTQTLKLLSKLIFSM